MRGRFLIAIALLFTSFAHAQMLGVGYREVFTSGGGGSTVTYTGNGCGAQAPPVATSLACTTASSVTAGQTIFVNVTSYATPAPTITDSNTGTIVNVTGGTSGTTTAVGMYDWVWAIENAGAGVHTVTVSQTSLGYGTVIVDVLNGASTTSPVDNASASGLKIYATANCSSVTTASANEFLLTFGNVADGNTTLTPDTTPQTMTSAYLATPAAASAYGTGATAGTNYVGWSSSFTGGTYMTCDTIAVH